MDWHGFVDIYCERVAPGFWAEPFNALTNLAFIAAAAVAWSRAGTDSGARRDGAFAALTALVVVIGVGSFLFHTFANTWSMLADVIPISVFIFTYLGFALRRYFSFGWSVTVLGVAGFMAVSFAVDMLTPAGTLFGSIGYLPAVVAIVALGCWLGWRGHDAASALILAGALLAVSLVLRTVDIPLCAHWPVGTHAAWHILNAVVLYLLLRLAARHRTVHRGN